MTFIFLDTSYLQALANPGDDLHQRAIEVTERLGVFVPVTSEMLPIPTSSAHSYTSASVSLFVS